MTKITLDTFILQTVDDLEAFRKELTSVGANNEPFSTSDFIETFSYWLNDKYSGDPPNETLGED